MVTRIGRFSASSLITSGSMRTILSMTALVFAGVCGLTWTFVAKYMTPLSRRVDCVSLNCAQRSSASFVAPTDRRNSLTLLHLRL